MANYTVTDTELTNIADAIITKAGLSGQLEFPDDFVDGIEGISSGTDVSDTTATAGDVLSGKYFYTSSAVKTQGTIATKTSSDLTASGKTVTVPAGYYASQATKDVATGSATTPATTATATVTISLNSSTGVITATASGTKSITPTVSAGYVSSGTAGTVTINGSNTQTISAWNGGNYGGETTISFSLAGFSYQAEEGMTWNAFAVSNYNSGGRISIISGTSVAFTDGARAYVKYNNSFVTPSDAIVANANYSLGFPK